jgi:histidine ammonia-lyase
MRCAPQVHGAAREALEFVRRTLLLEANAAPDNPMVFVGNAGGSEGDEILSGGNFHGAPVALAADFLVLALAQFATISERRSDRLVNPVLSDLPAFLTRHSGLQSGFMMTQVTAAALASEIKTLAVPASADTIPTSANREDHVSMSMGAAHKASRALHLATRVVAIELLCGAQAIDLLAPLQPSTRLQHVHAALRSRVAMLIDDRAQSPDIEAIAVWIAEGSLDRACAEEVK